MTCVPNNLATQIFKGVTLNSTPKLSVEKPKLLKLAKAIVSKYHSKIGGGGSKYERTPKISNSYSYFFVFFADRRKNRHKTRRRQYIFVTNL